MDRLLHMKKAKWLLVFILGWWTIALFATGTVLPDSMVTEDKVYEYTSVRDNELYLNAL